ncbi:MAG: MBL fold metallo-hydrolase [Armatimonadota bacterium]
MILKRFYDDKLAQASYLVGCPAAQACVIIDPNRDAYAYLEAAEQEGLSIVGVTETHIHADFLSGARELARLADATLYLSDEGDADWKYAFADEPNVRLVKDGDVIRVGAVRLDVLHTPGHTPEHISFLLTDEAASNEPLGIFSGDFVFVGDVGRPDLLEKAAGASGTMEVGAKRLYESLQRLGAFPDSLLIFPGHGAGSACGKGLGGVPVSSLGYEKKVGWAWKTPSVQQFVQAVLEGQPDSPRYFKEMKRMNKEGPPPRGKIAPPERLKPDKLFAHLAGDTAVVFDVRTPAEFAQGHLPGTLNLFEGRTFPIWAGWLLPYDRPLAFIAHDEEEARQVAKDLALIGMDNLIGWAGIEALDAWRASRPLKMTHTADAASARVVCSSADIVLDVRNRNEYEAGHLEGATNIPLGRLPERLSELPQEGSIVVYCQTGGRASIATSLLMKAGFSSVVNLEGGYNACVQHGQASEAALPGR